MNVYIFLTPAGPRKVWGNNRFIYDKLRTSYIQVTHMLQQVLLTFFANDDMLHKLRSFLVVRSNIFYLIEWRNLCNMSLFAAIAKKSDCNMSVTCP